MFECKHSHMNHYEASFPSPKIEARAWARLTVRGPLIDCIITLMIMLRKREWDSEILERENEDSEISSDFLEWVSGSRYIASDPGVSLIRRLSVCLIRRLNRCRAQGISYSFGEGPKGRLRYKHNIISELSHCQETGVIPCSHQMRDVPVSFLQPILRIPSPRVRVLCRAIGSIWSILFLDSK